MKLPNRHFPRILAVLTALVLAVPPGRADDGDDAGTTARVKFSDPSQPGTLKCSLPWAEVHVVATDGDEIIVTSSLDEKNGREEVDSEGFRRLDSDVAFELTEKGNVATISLVGDNAWQPNGAEFEIKVPARTNLVLRSEMGGEIHVAGVQGDIDVNTMNGEVTLEEIGNSAVVNTLNGEIRATFRKAPTKAVSLSTMNGEISLSIPSDTKANLRMRTHNGAIRTNFSEGILQAKPEKVARGSSGSPDLHAPPVRVERETLAKELAEAGAEAGRIAREAAREAQEAVAAALADADAAPDAMPRAPAPPMPPIPARTNFGKGITGTLNGGGIDIKLTSMNGTITLRETK